MVGRVIRFQDGREAKIIGGQLVFGVGDGIALSEAIVRSLPSAFPVDISDIAPPVMFAALTIAGESANVALTLKDYQLLAVAGLKARPAPVSQATRMLQTARTTIQHRFGGCCGKK